MKKLQLILVLAVLAMAGQSCVSSKKFNALQAEKDALAQSLSDIQNKLKMMEAERQKLAEERDALNSKVDMANKDIAGLKSELDAAKKAAAESAGIRDAVRNALRYYEKSGLTVEERDDRLYLTNAQPILFRSGSVRLSKEGRDFLGTLAGTLKANPDIILMVEGHADKRPISTSRFSDNWDLSVIRATAVVRELTKNGVAPRQLTAAGRGEHASAGDDLTQNRRAEFIILPRMSALSSLIK
jgi:chemotaxis protein MotB